MADIISLDDLRAKLATSASPTEYRLFFAALLRREAGIPVDDFYIVGGSAVEIYTVGRYTSGDVDVVTHDRARILEVLRHWEFKREGRIWTNEGMSIVLDLVKPPYTGSVDRTALLTTPFGSVRLAAAEDLLVKRLSSAINWGQPGDIEHAKMLAIEFRDKLDWDYIEKFAEDHQVLETAKELRARVDGSKPKRKA